MSDFSRGEIEDMHPKGKPLTPEGAEVPDSTPMAPPIGYKRVPSLSDQIREMIRSERLRQEAEAAGMETFDEADDFDVGDDYDPRSPYELDADLPPVEELRRRQSSSSSPEPKETKSSPDQGEVVIGRPEGEPSRPVAASRKRAGVVSDVVVEDDR